MSPEDCEATERFQIGICPACRGGLWAEVDLGVKIGVPYLESDGRAKVYVEALKRGMRIHHWCRLDADSGYWRSSDDEPLADWERELLEAGPDAPPTAPLSDAQPPADHRDGSGAGGASEGEGGK